MLGFLLADLVAFRLEFLAAVAAVFDRDVGVPGAAFVLVPFLGEGPAAFAPGPFTEVMPYGFVAVVFLPGQEFGVGDPVVVRYRELKSELRV